MVRCGMCHRVREAPGEPWVWTREPHPNAVTGYCAVCADLKKLSRKRGWEAVGAQLLKDRAKGYGPAPEGTNVFKGFKGE